jgi:hypothetical protein
VGSQIAFVLGSAIATVGVLHWFRPYAFDRFGVSWWFGMPTRSLSRGARRLGAVLSVVLGVVVATLGMLSMVSG